MRVGDGKRVYGGGKLFAKSVEQREGGKTDPKNRRMMAIDDLHDHDRRKAHAQDEDNLIHFGCLWRLDAGE